MKKVFLSTITIVTFIAYGIYQRSKDTGSDSLVTTEISSSSSSSKSSSSLNSLSPTVSGKYKDGSYMGKVADAFYGLVQIKVIVENGSVTAVDFLSYPNDRSTSRQINSRAMPILKSEAIVAQSANVKIVSGASDTSQAFIESLSSALDQAKVQT